MKASDYGIKNLKVIIAKLPEWTRQPNEGYDDLDNMYNQLTAQFNRYMGHVTKNIGGIYENPKTVEEAGVVYEYTPAATQKEAMDFLNRQLFTTPTWMLDEKILSNIGETPVQVVYTSQNGVLTRILTFHTLNKLLAGEAADGQTAYKVTDLFSDLNNSILTELKGNQAIDIYRRNLQKLYIDKLIALVKPKVDPNATALAAGGGGGRRAGGPAREMDQTDALSVVKGQLRIINDMIKAKMQNTSDAMTSYHLQDLSERITAALDPKG